MLSSLALALATISRNRLRAGLTVLGILIGVAALVAVTALAAGVSNKISGSMSGFASDALTIAPQVPASGSKIAPPRKLTEADAQALSDSRAITSVAPLLTNRVQVIYGDHNEATLAVGTTTAYFEIQRTSVARGTLWTATEEARKEKVCVLGSSLASRLFGKDDPVGKLVRIGRVPCNVIAVLGALGSMPGGEDPDNRVLLPIGSFRARLRPTAIGDVDAILLKAVSTERASRDVTSILRQTHHIREEAPSDFSVTTPDELQALQLTIAAALSALLICVSAVSLLVGGIGVMNIMLVSVAERTREIGIRISIGARARHILLQFLIEAVVLSLMGGALGLVLGVIMSYGLGKVVSLDLSPSPIAGVIAVVSSGTIGVVFGLLPARRAARLNPIQALRTD